jgi:hypothetical protein
MAKRKGEMTLAARRGRKAAWSKDAGRRIRTGCESTVPGELARDSEAHFHQAHWHYIRWLCLEGGRIYLGRCGRSRNGD